MKRMLFIPLLMVLGLASDKLPSDNKYNVEVSYAYNLLKSAINSSHLLIDDWTNNGKAKGSQVQRHEKTLKGFKGDSARSLKMFRGEKILDFAPNVLFHASGDKRIVPSLRDELFKNIRTLETIDNNHKVKLEQYGSPVFFIWPREVVYVNTIYHEPENEAILVFDTSVDYPAAPVTNGYVRGDLIIGGWAFIPIPDQPNKTRVVFVECFDPAGFIPSWIIDRINQDIPLTVEKLENAVKNFGDLKDFYGPLSGV